MGAFAMYRLPYAETYTKVTQEEEELVELYDYSALSGCRGFCIAPFAISPNCPVLVIRPERVEEDRIIRIEKDGLLVEQKQKHALSSLQSAHQRKSYAQTFERFHSALIQGQFRKLVLARCAEEEIETDNSLEDLFFCACNLYPRMFVALVSSEKSGTWLAATPEILLEGSSRYWHTVALAGTMRLEGHQLSFDTPENDSGKVEITWSTKNIQEQHYVATYIKDCLTKFTDDITEEGPMTVRAGNLVHLRSDFRFSLMPHVNIGELIESLHPTPAVCGLPKDKAYRFIQENESSPRRYYSGFMGPLGINGSTHLYVSLRCMRIEDAKCSLYAGGGLLKDSVEEQEWNETEAKLETMRKCIAIKRM